MCLRRERLVYSVKLCILTTKNLRANLQNFSCRLFLVSRLNKFVYRLSITSQSKQVIRSFNSAFRNVYTLRKAFVSLCIHTNRQVVEMKRGFALRKTSTSRKLLKTHTLFSSSLNACFRSCKYIIAVRNPFTFCG